jgi:hypothetical protein
MRCVSAVAVRSLSSAAYNLLKIGILIMGHLERNIVTQRGNMEYLMYQVRFS